MRTNLALAGRLALAGLAVSPVAGAAQQGPGGPRTLMPRDAEVALARTAAPAAISARARVWVLTAQGYVVADSGSSGVNCYVGRPWPASVEPHCLDEEASATVMPILMERVKLYMQGKDAGAVDGEIAAAVVAGRFRLPRRPAMTYMMSAAQNLITGDGNAVGAWQPHLMIYYPYLSAEGVGLPGFVPGVGFVENPEQALSALVIPLRDFVPAPAGR
jgi:hypothetical protein